MLKIKTVVFTALSIILFSIAVPALAFAYKGGDWNYGGYHDPVNWGAFSNYYHGSCWHWSYVASGTRNNQSYAESYSLATSYAFINTYIGEYIVFDAGL